LTDAHKVLAPKIEGARILNNIISDGSVDVFAVFSSTSVLLEPPGQSDYIAANRVLDAIAGARSRRFEYCLGRVGRRRHGQARGGRSG
jgi:hypothetical protein